MISREGMETALLLLQLRQTLQLVAGALLGLGGAAAVAWLWSRFGHRVNLVLFLQTTAIFLFVFVIQLFIQGIHEMSEQSYLPYSQFIHDATEAWGPDSTFGHLLTYLMVLLPAAWLAIKGSRVSKPALPKPSFTTSAAHVRSHTKPETNPNPQSRMSA
jgi:high-affinity iron transporter